MSLIKDLRYISRAGHRAEVGHPLDDPYLGRPKSELGALIMREGPIGVSWINDGHLIEKRFDNRIQAALDEQSNCVVVIGHWGAPISHFDVPNNGVVFGADGAVIREIAAPLCVAAQERVGHENPDALSVVKRVEDGIEIWIAHDEGRWHERRIFDPSSGKWGAVTGQYRAV
jgi:hypothetical protein